MNGIADNVGWVLLYGGAVVLCVIAVVGLVLAVQTLYRWWHRAEVRHDPTVCSVCRWNQDRTE